MTSRSTSAPRPASVRARTTGSTPLAKSVRLPLGREDYERLDRLATYAGYQGRSAIRKMAHLAMLEGLAVVEDRHGFDDRARREPRMEAGTLEERVLRDRLVNEALSLFGGEIVEVRPHDR